MFQGDDAEVSAQLRLFAEQTRDFVGVSDAWGRIIYLNPAARKRLGVAEAAELSITDVFPAEELALYYEVARPQLLLTGAWSGEIRVNVGGEGAVPMYVSTSATVGPGGAIDGLVIHAREVPRADSGAGTASDGFEIDEVTGLLTRPGFEHRVRLALAAAERDGDGCALVLVDIVGMSATIETFGPVAAVRVVRSLAGRLTRFARTIDVAGRVGEHQLGLLLRNVRNHGEASRIAEMLRESLVDPPVTTAGGEVVAFIGCGVAFSRSGDDADALMERAAEAVAYSPGDRDADALVTVARVGGSDAAPSMDELRRACGNREMRPYAQRVVDLRSGLIVAYRGVVRWQHPRLGLLDTEAFVDLIADTPLANQVDLYVAREMAAVITLLLREQPLSLYTPVSRRSIADVRMELYLSEIADAYFLSLNQMRLQIARDLVADCPPPLRDAMSSLSDAGIPLVLTDVDSAFDIENLAPGFQEVHIAPRLTNAAASGPAARFELSAIVRLAHDRGLVVAAAGVSNLQERDALSDAGCDLAHGVLFAALEPAENIE